MRGLKPWLAAVAALAFGSSALVLEKKEQIISDGTYLVFAGLALAAMIAVERRGWDVSRPIAAAALVLAPMLLAYGTRPVGLALIVAFVSYQVFVKRHVTWFTVLVVGGFVA